MKQGWGSVGSMLLPLPTIVCSWISTPTYKDLERIQLFPRGGETYTDFGDDFSQTGHTGFL